MMFRIRAASALALLALLATTLGCYNPFNPPSIGFGNAEPPPAPSDPPGLLRLYEWCYSHRAISEYSELFTADYRFVFSELDSNGNAYRDVPFTREDELISTGRLFSGGNANEPGASEIILLLDRSFAIFPDTRPGKNPAWHKTINTTVNLTIRFTDGSQTEVRGRAKFFMVRGDSALIPEDMEAKGFGPDPNRWYIERWEDDTGAEGAPNLVGSIARDSRGPETTMGYGARPSDRGAAAPMNAIASTDSLPTLSTWGGVKEFYRLGF